MSETSVEAIIPKYLKQLKHGFNYYRGTFVVTSIAGQSGSAVKLTEHDTAIHGATKYVARGLTPVQAHAVACRKNAEFVDSRAKLQAVQSGMQVIANTENPTADTSEAVIDLLTDILLAAEYVDLDAERLLKHAKDMTSTYHTFPLRQEDTPEPC